MAIVHKVTPFFADERGEMSYLLDKESHITSVLLITCKKNAVRANHYHKKDTHYSYLLKGSMEYTYQSRIGKDRQKKTIIVRAGETVETPPNTLHAMKFREDSVFLAMTTEPRDREKYEKDTMRVKVI